MTKKAIIFILDALLAAVIVASFIATYLQTVPTDLNPNAVVLPRHASETLLRLESVDLLSDAVITSNTDQIQLYLNTTLPVQICGNVSVFTNADALVYSVQKTDCNISQAADKAVKVGSLFAQDAIYHTQLITWIQ